MVLDIDTVELTPGNFGYDCKGNGRHLDDYGKVIECCCDECNYLLCCTAENINCSKCDDFHCKRNPANKA